MADVLKPDGVVRPVGDQSTAELVHLASDQVSRLVRNEIALAKLELSEKGKHAGFGIGMFGGSAVFAFYGVGAGIATAIIALALVLDLWLSALIVTAALFVLAGLLALIGKVQVSKATKNPPTATESVKADVDEVKQAVARERNQA